MAPATSASKSIGAEIARLPEEAVSTAVLGGTGSSGAGVAGLISIVPRIGHRCLPNWSVSAIRSAGLRVRRCQHLHLRTVQGLQFRPKRCHSRSRSHR